MSEIEGEVVDTQESSEATEPVETTDSVEASEPAAEAAPAEETVEETTDSEPSVVDWNGEVKSLGDAEWFNGIEESSRQALLQGIETKYKNWQRGYTKAFEENATKRKSLDDRETGIAAQEARVTRWLYGEGDPIGDLKKELDGLKSTHEERLAALKEEHEKSVGQASTGRTDELESLIKERDEALGRITEFETQIHQREEGELETAVDEFETWIKDAAQDVYESDEAFYSLCVLCTGGVDRNDALEMVRGKFSIPEPEPEPEPEPVAKPEPVPPAVGLMNLGTGHAGGTSTGETREFADIMDALRREAQK